MTHNQGGLEEAIPVQSYITAKGGRAFQPGPLSGSPKLYLRMLSHV